MALPASALGLTIISTHTGLPFLTPEAIAETIENHKIFGCTGGAHRSVAIAEHLAAFLRQQGHPVSVTHRDLALEQAHWKSSAEG